MRVVRNRLQPAGRVFYGVMQALLCAACLWMARVTWDAGRLAGSVDPGDPYVTVFRVQAAVFLAGAAATAALAVLFARGSALAVTPRERWGVLVLVVALLAGGAFVIGAAPAAWR